MMSRVSWMTSFLCLALVAGVLLFSAAPAHAIAPEIEDTCTSFSENAQKMAQQMAVPDGSGMLSEIYRYIKRTVNDSTQRLYESFTDNDGYQSAVFWAMVLMVIFYGVAFVIGVVQPSFQQVLIRLIKMAIIWALIAPSYFFDPGYDVFDRYVVRFFQDGTDQIVETVQAIGFGIEFPEDPTDPDRITPFFALDTIANFLIQPDTLIMIMGSLAAGGPYGLFMGSLSAIALGGFFTLMLKALQTYAVSFVARAMVLGVAPIFIVFLLFDRTKNLFVSWLNALVNLSLQPILMFTFLSFFLVLMQSSVTTMLGTELCWSEYTNVEGSTNKMSFWKFKDESMNATIKSDMTYAGALECILNPDPLKNCKEFPVNIVDLLSFLILVFLAQRFSEVVLRISGELSNAMVALDMQGKLDQFAHNMDKKAGAGLSGANTHAGGQSSGGGGSSASNTVRNQSQNMQGRRE